MKAYEIVVVVVSRLSQCNEINVIKNLRRSISFHNIWDVAKKTENDSLGQFYAELFLVLNDENHCI